jgi:hypothetical protein
MAWTSVTCDRCKQVISYDNEGGPPTVCYHCHAQIQVFEGQQDSGGCLALFLMAIVGIVVYYVWRDVSAVGVWLWHKKWWILGILALFAFSMTTEAGRKGYRRGYRNAREGRSMSDEDP